MLVINIENIRVFGRTMNKDTTKKKPYSMNLSCARLDCSSETIESCRRSEDTGDMGGAKKTVICNRTRITRG